MTHEKFALDNTEGYDQSQLDELNRRYERLAEGVDDPSILDSISENVLRDFDNEWAS